MNFLTDAGALASGGAILRTDAQGAVQDTLTATQQQVQSLGVGAFFTVSAQTASLGGQILEDSSQIRIQSSAPIALFDLASAGGFKVKFTFTGSGREPLAFQWTFCEEPCAAADVLGTSILRDPTFDYLNAGNYRAQLTVTNEFPPPDTAERRFTLPLQ